MPPLESESDHFTGRPRVLRIRCLQKVSAQSEQSSLSKLVSSNLEEGKECLFSCSCNQKLDAQMHRVHGHATFLEPQL